MPSVDISAWLITTHAPTRILSGYQNIQGDIIAVDGGLAVAAENSLIPKVLIGDFDSLDQDLLKNYPDIQIIRHQPQKNETDTELALKWCLDSGCYQKIVICNDMQGRVDHSLAIIQNLLELHRKGVDIAIETERQRLFFIREDTTLKGNKGDLISLISYSREARFLRSMGLEYPLEGLVIHQHQSRGISNVFVNDCIEIALAAGEVLAIYSPRMSL